MKQITQEELTEIKELQSEFAQHMTELGTIELQLSDIQKALEEGNQKKKELFSNITLLRSKEQKIATELNEKYGTGVIDINTGTITEK